MVCTWQRVYANNVLHLFSVRTNLMLVDHGAVGAGLVTLGDALSVVDIHSVSLWSAAVGDDISIICHQHCIWCDLISIDHGC